MDFHSLANSLAVYVLVNDDFLNKPVQHHSVQFLDVGIVLDDFQPACAVLLLLGLLGQPFPVQHDTVFQRGLLRLAVFQDAVEVVLADALGNHILVHPANNAFQSGDAFAVLVNAPLDSLTLGLLVCLAVLPELGRCLLFIGKGLSRTGPNLFQHDVVECIILDAVLGTVGHAILVVAGTGVNPFVAFLIGPADVQGAAALSALHQPGEQTENLYS